MNKKVKQEIEKIIKLFESGDVPEATAQVLLPRQEIPCSHWSLLNRIICFMSGTKDARGFKQWKTVDRFVKKGCKAIYILAPRIRKKKEDGEDKVLAGFIFVPVFKYEDTEGKSLPEFPPPEPPILRNVADRWNIKVSYPGSLGNNAFGYYAEKEIVLSTHAERTFCHELAHAAHERVRGDLKVGQQWDQEIVAELSAATLLRLYGRTTNEGRSYNYISAYAKKAGKDISRACMSVISDVEAVLKEILDASGFECSKADVA